MSGYSQFPDGATSELQQPRPSSKLKWITILVMMALVTALVILVVRDVRRSDGGGGGGGGDGGNVNRVPIEVTNRVSAMMNTAADPCTDFFEYACGGFRKSFVPPPERATPYVESFNFLANQTSRQLLDLMTFELPLLGTYYDSCMSTDAIDAQGSAALSPVFGLIARVAAANANANDFWNVVGELKRYGLAPDVLVDWSVEPFELVYRLVLVTSSPNAVIAKGAAANMNRLLDLFASEQLPGSIASAEERAAVAARMVPLVAELLQLTINGTQLPDPDEGTAGLAFSTPAEFEQATSLPLNSAFLPGLAKDSLATGSQVPVAPERMAYSDPYRYVNIANLVHNAYTGSNATDALTPVVLRSMLQLQVVTNLFFLLPKKYAAAWAGQLLNGAVDSAALAQVMRMPPPRVTPGRPSPIPPFVDPHTTPSVGAFRVGDAERSTSCVEQTLAQFKDLLTKQWIARSFPANNKATGVALTNRVHDQLQTRLKTVDWLDDATRARALEKWSLMKANVAYDPLNEFDKYEGVALTDSFLKNTIVAGAHNTARNQLRFIASATQPTVASRDRFPNGVGLLVQNAYYYPSMNSINLLLGLMQEPLFASRYPDMLNLAAYGFVIGHEFTHGFDNNGRQFNGTGFRVNWWTDEAAKQFETRAKCLIDQYETFFVDAAQTVHVHGLQTLGENIADLGGLGLAWAAYKNLPTVPQLMPQNNLTNDQLFWTYAGQVWCSVGTEDQYKYQVAKDVHSPGIFRVNGPMSNIKGFAESFSCKSDSVMGRSLTDKQCQIW